MIKLQEGAHITLEELAEWFGVSYSTIRKKDNKIKKLSLLSHYADYHFEGKIIVIDRVYIEEYSKAYAFIKEKLPEVWNKSNLDTCAHVGTIMYNKYTEVSSQIKITSAKAYTNRAKIELFGRNHIDNDIGELGISRYCWGTMDANGQCYHLPEEHEKIVSECAQICYGGILSQRAALLNDALNKGEISEREYCEGMALTKEERAEAFSQFEGMIFSRLGYMPMRLTEITYGSEF